MICWGNGDTHEKQNCVEIYDFGDGRVIRITRLHLIRRDYMGLFRDQSDTGLRYVEMAGFPPEEEREFRALRDANNDSGMKHFIKSRWPSAQP